MLKKEFDSRFNTKTLIVSRDEEILSYAQEFCDVERGEWEMVMKHLSHSTHQLIVSWNLTPPPESPTLPQVLLSHVSEIIQMCSITPPPHPCIPIQSCTMKDGVRVAVSKYHSLHVVTLLVFV